MPNDLFEIFEINEEIVNLLFADYNLGFVDIKREMFERKLNDLYLDLDDDDDGVFSVFYDKNKKVYVVKTYLKLSFFETVSWIEKIYDGVFKRNFEQQKKKVSEKFFSFNDFLGELKFGSNKERIIDFMDKEFGKLIDLEKKWWEKKIKPKDILRSNVLDFVKSKLSLLIKISKSKSTDVIESKDDLSKKKIDDDSNEKLSCEIIKLWKLAILRQLYVEYKKIKRCYGKNFTRDSSVNCGDLFIDSDSENYEDSNKGYFDKKTKNVNLRKIVNIFACELMNMQIPKEGMTKQEFESKIVELRKKLDSEYEMGELIKLFECPGWFEINKKCFYKATVIFLICASIAVFSLLIFNSLNPHAWEQIALQSDKFSTFFQFLIGTFALGIAGSVCSIIGLVFSQQEAPKSGILEKIDGILPKKDVSFAEENIVEKNSVSENIQEKIPEKNTKNKKFEKKKPHNKCAFESIMEKISLFSKLNSIVSKDQNFLSEKQSKIKLVSTY